MDALGLFAELRETIENLIEHATRFTGANHIDEELVEDLRVRLKGFRKVITLGDAIDDVGEDDLEGRIAFLLSDQFKGAEQR